MLIIAKAYQSAQGPLLVPIPRVRRGHIARACRSPVTNYEPGRTVIN